MTRERLGKSLGGPQSRQQSPPKRGGSGETSKEAGEAMGGGERKEKRGYRRRDWEGKGNSHRGGDRGVCAGCKSREGPS